MCGFDFVVTKLLCNIFITKLKFPCLALLSSPYIAHDASCVMLNIDWTPLLSVRTVRHLSVCLSVCVSVCLSAYLSRSHTLLIRA